MMLGRKKHQIVFIIVFRFYNTTGCLLQKKIKSDSFLSFRYARKIQSSAYLHILHSFGWSVTWYRLVSIVAISKNGKFRASDMGCTQFL